VTSEREVGGCSLHSNGVDNEPQCTQRYTEFEPFLDQGHMGRWWVMVGRIGWRCGLIHDNHGTQVREHNEQDDHCYCMNFGSCKVNLDNAFSVVAVGGWRVSCE
jgi:hypothetical protein